MKAAETQKIGLRVVSESDKDSMEKLTALPQKRKERAKPLHKLS